MPCDPHMPPRPLQHLIVLCLAAWMSMCCCEKRILAHAFAGAPEAAPSCCGGACCGDEASVQGADSRHRGGDHRPGGCCADGCCAKAAPNASVFDLAVDAIGTPMLAVLVAHDVDPRCARAPAHEDRAVGEPPPRLALLISRRLRI
jgi:hypothetical protein